MKTHPHQRTPFSGPSSHSNITPVVVVVIVFIVVVAFLSLICRRFFASLLCNDMIMVCSTILHRHFVVAFSVVQFHKNSIKSDSCYIFFTNITFTPPRTHSELFRNEKLSNNHLNDVDAFRAYLNLIVVGLVF